MVANTATHKQVNFLTPPKGSVQKKKTLKIDSKGHAVDSNQLYMAPETQKLWFLLQVNKFKKNIFLKEICQKSKMDTTIDFVKTPNTQEIILSWKLFRKIIWNRRIITLVVWMIKLDEKPKTKMSCLILRFFEKIKQVSSTKLTNWYKNISRWKTNKFLHRLIFLGANLKVSKILLQSLRASFRKTKNYFSGKSLQSPKHRDLAFSFLKRRKDT